MNAVAPHREALARRLHEEHRAIGSAFWPELSDRERQRWYRVARHIEKHVADAITLEELARK